MSQNKYYETNKEKYKLYYQANKENFKLYYQNNKDKIKKYNAENKEYIKQYNKDYYEKNIKKQYGKFNVKICEEIIISICDN